MDVSRVLLLAAWAGGASLFSSLQAQAATFNVLGISSPVTAEVEFDYSFINSSSGQIDLTIKNTSGVQGAVTGFAFNAPTALSVTGMTTDISNLLPDPAWVYELSYNSENLPQLNGNFDFGACSPTCGNIPGSGTVATGISTGNSGQFVISLSGTAMNTLTTSSFLDLLSQTKQGAIGETFFALRFQGLPDSYNTGSDVAIPTPVPLPAGVWLLLSALGGLGVMGWNSRKSVSA